MCSNMHLNDEPETDCDSELLPAPVSGVTVDGRSFSLIWEPEDDSDSELLSSTALPFTLQRGSSLLPSTERSASQSLTQAHRLHTFSYGHTHTQEHIHLL